MQNLYPPKPMRAWPNSDFHARLVSDPDWIVEPKYDGDRCLVVYSTAGIQLWSRHGKLLKHSWLNNLRQELASLALPAGTILDGELCAEPKPNQDLFVFDIPSVPGTLLSRRKVLSEIFYEGEFNYIYLSPWLDKEAALNDAVSSNWEGLVWKNINSQYQWHRQPQNTEITDWVKMKV